MELIDRILHTYLSCNNYSLSNLSKLKVEEEDMFTLVDMAIVEFQKGPTLAEISPPCTVVGDIHGQYQDLLRLLNLSKDMKDVKQKKKRRSAFCTKRWVFLGDYVDRGSLSIETVTLVFALRLKYPEQYVLLRGNHETRTINGAYGFKEDICNKYNSLPLWERFNEAFSWMPLACLIGGGILCMHGGISPRLQSLDDIRNIKRPIVDVATNKLAQDLLWADPMEPLVNVADAALSQEPEYMHNKIRGLSVTFNEAAVKDVCSKLNLHLIIRAHQMIMEGFKFFCGRKLVTIFSAPYYMEQTDNQGMTLDISETGVISFRQMRSHKFKKKGMPAIPDEVTRGDSVKTGGSKSKNSSSTKSI